MNGQLTAHSHIEITETLVRLYVFLAQNLDRCLNEAARTTYPKGPSSLDGQEHPLPPPLLNQAGRHRAR